MCAAQSSKPATQEAKPVQPIYKLDRKTMPRIEAVEYRVKESLSHIFSVPERGSIGTNSMNNAITVLDLSGKRVKYREVRRNFIDEAESGDMVFLPEFSKDTIGYSQTRGFLLFNVKTGEFRDRLMVRLLQLTIQDVAVLDWEKRLFLFNMDFTPGFDGSTADLHMMDLSGPEPKDVATFEIKKEPLWAALGKTTFYFTKEGERLKLHALDEWLKPVEHPLLAIYDARFPNGEAELPTVHPNHPIAIFATEEGASEDTLSVLGVSWRSPEDKASSEPRSKAFKLLESMSGGFRFSPDGKWVLFRDRTGGPLRYVAMPVDPALPHYFGPPVLLETKEEVSDRWNGNCAWISDPVSVVCKVTKSERKALTGEEFEVTKLLKWELPAGKAQK
jgi:hypothetical protein